MSRGFSPLALAGFSALFRPWMRRRLAGVRLAGLPARLPAGRPLLLVSNHVSWWDAFVLWEVQRALRPGAPIHTLMLESELRRAPFLRRIGALGIEPTAPASLGRAARELARRLRERPDSVVLFFPQGQIWPSYRRPLGFRRGVEWLVGRLQPLTVLPVGIHLEPLTRAAPHAFASVGAPIPGDQRPTAQHLEARVEGEIDRILDFLATHGEEAARRWPDPRSPLPRPESGHALLTGGWPG